MSSVHCNHQMLCEVVRECNTVSCSGNKNIILGLYDVYNFVFIYIKIHLISKDASIFSERSLFFNSSSSWSHITISISLPRTDVQSTIVQVGYLTHLAHSRNTATGFTQFYPLFQDLLNLSTSSPAISAGCVSPPECTTTNQRVAMTNCSSTSLASAPSSSLLFNSGAIHEHVSSLGKYHIWLFSYPF